MHDSSIVRGLQRLGQLAGDRQRFIQRQCAAQDALREVLSVDELHRDRVHRARLLDAVNRRDVGVVERGQRLRLAREPRQPVIVSRDGVGQDLERDVSLQPEVAGAVHLAHSTCAEAIDDLVRTNVLARRETHDCRRLYGGRVNPASTSPGF